ncbi:hypothetical protein J2T17_007117 [Paenibacillus mucilaginosus]|uniref:PrgI family mobile element protein n=1 Tax=Paenibacillus mucilaginosus TaxID=61624 RepID=UPI003D203E32
MNGEIVVPIDITEEEKSILAIFSLRQFFMVIPTAVITLIFLVWGGFPFISGFIDFGFRLLFFIVINLFVLACAFWKMDRYEQYLSDFLITQFKFKRSQKTYF